MRHIGVRAAQPSRERPGKVAGLTTSFGASDAMLKDLGTAPRLRRAGRSSVRADRRSYDADRVRERHQRHGAPRRDGHRLPAERDARDLVGARAGRTARTDRADGTDGAPDRRDHRDRRVAKGPPERLDPRDRAGRVRWSWSIRSTRPSVYRSMSTRRRSRGSSALTGWRCRSRRLVSPMARSPSSTRAATARATGIS